MSTTADHAALEDALRFVANIWVTGLCPPLSDADRKKVRLVCDAASARGDTRPTSGTIDREKLEAALAYYNAAGGWRRTNGEHFRVLLAAAEAHRGTVPNSTAIADQAGLTGALDVVAGFAPHQSATGWATIPEAAFKTIVVAAQARLDDICDAKTAWRVSDPVAGGWQHFEDLDDALALARTWVRQSAGDIVIGRRGVEA